MSKASRWHVCVFVFFATVLNYMDRQTLSVVAPLIQEEFRLDNAQLGALFSAFFVSYGIAVALIGELIDRVSIRIAFAAAVAWWSLSTSLTGLARSFGQLLGFRLSLGLGEAANWPITARLVSMYLPPRERTLANSIYMGGGSLGLVIVGPLLVWMSVKYGWRTGFLAIGCFSILWLIAWLWWFRPRNTQTLERHDTAAERGSAATWREVVRLPRFWGLVVASICGNTCIYFLMNWLPSFLAQDRGIRFGMKLGTVIIFPFLGLDLGYVVSGFGILALGRRGWTVLKARRVLLLLSATVMSVSMVAVPGAGTNIATAALLFAGAFGMAGWNSNYLCFVEELSPRKAAAVAGVVGSAGAFAGAASLWGIGLISKLAGNFTPVFFMVAGLIWIASAGILLTREPRRSDPPPLGDQPAAAGAG
jgi:ACS family hexuronate transporter-like MFS transporter